MNSYSECKAIADLDLDPIKVKLMHQESGEGWSLEQANAIEGEYRRFLYLMKIFPEEQTAPLADVDTFWHYHILDTMKYAADCDQIFGYFLHHFPYIGLRGEEDLEAHHRVGERMRELYEQTFGEPYIRTAQPAQDTAFSSRIANSAFSSATARSAFSSAVAKSAFSSAVAKSAFSSAVAKSAFSSAVAKSAFSSAVAKSAFSSAVAKSAFSSAVAKSAFSSATARSAFSSATARSAFSSATASKPLLPADSGDALSGATGDSIDQQGQTSRAGSTFYTQRPALMAA